MNIAELLQTNLLSPVVLAFLLGIVATLIRSDLEFPEQIYSGLSIYLLLAIGLKGGAALSESGFGPLWHPALATMGMGIVIPIASYFVLRRMGRFSVDDSAAIAAHYGSCSVVTFVAAVYFAQRVGLSSDGFMPSLVAILEVPAIIVALLIARSQSKQEGASWGAILHEVVAGRSVLLLVGGMVIGYVAGKEGFDRVAPLFVTPFQGFLVLFMLELGMVTAKRFADLKRVGIFLLGFGMIMPIFHAVLGAYVAKWTGLQMGSALILATLAASASYIAAPAACRVGLPRANPAYYLTASLAITFPFNLAIGIPLYYQITRMVYGA